MTQEERKTQKEKFLAIQTFEEYKKKEKEFLGIDIKDREIRNHYFKKLKPTSKVKCYNGEASYIVDDNDKCILRNGIPHGMTRDEYLDFVRAKRKEYFKNKKN